MINWNTACYQMFVPLGHLMLRARAVAIWLVLAARGAAWLCPVTGQMLLTTAQQ